jgi:hypothetical protein
MLLVSEDLSAILEALRGNHWKARWKDKSGCRIGLRISRQLSLGGESAREAPFVRAFASLVNMKL